MKSGIRRRAERVALVAMAAIGIAVLVADVFGWLDGLVDSDALPKVTLLILSTVTVFLLLELERLEVLDNVDKQLSKLDIDTVARELKLQHYCGVVRVHLRFPEETFTQLVESADHEITILQTWIPNLQRFEWALREAIIRRQVDVRVLLLHPSSPVARLREEALRRDPALAEDVKANVERCLSIFENVAAEVPERDQSRLQVRLYNSLPSIAVYKADEHYLVSSFLHGQLAIDSAQVEVDGSGTALGEQVERELATLWRVGCEIDLHDWRRSLSAIAL
jgi:hypothetical protein